MKLVDDTRGAAFRTSRRRLLGGLGLALVTTGAASTFHTGAFGSVDAPRGTNVTVADDPDAIVGLRVSDTVKKNKRDLLVDIVNDVGETVDFEASLDDCSQGTLYGPNGSGCTVAVTLAPGESASIDVEAAVKDQTIPFTITGNASAFGFEATRETSAVSGNESGAIDIKKLDGFAANSADDDWTIKNVTVEDADGDDDLDRIEFQVEDESGTVRGTLTESCGCNGGSKYKPNGNPAVRIDPDDSSDTVDAGVTYKLTVTAYDADGNSAFETRTATA